MRRSRYVVRSASRELPDGRWSAAGMAGCRPQPSSGVVAWGIAVAGGRSRSRPATSASPERTNTPGRTGTHIRTSRLVDIGWPLLPRLAAGAAHQRDPVVRRRQYPAYARTIATLHRD